MWRVGLRGSEEVFRGEESGRDVEGFLVRGWG